MMKKRIYQKIQLCSSLPSTLVPFCGVFSYTYFCSSFTGKTIPYSQINYMIIINLDRKVIQQHISTNRLLFLIFVIEISWEYISKGLQLFVLFMYILLIMMLCKFTFLKCFQLLNYVSRQLQFKKIAVYTSNFTQLYCEQEQLISDSNGSFMNNHRSNDDSGANFRSVVKKPQKADDQFFDVSHIVKGIYIGDRKVSLNKNHLRKLGIKHILVAGEQLQIKFQNEFNYLKIHIKDSIKANLVEVLEKTNGFIDQCMQKKENILIHCAFGVSRSASFLLAYMIFKFKMSYEESFHFVKQRRPQIKPNEGFREQLKKYSLLHNKK